jgi:hypothetical protein
MADFRLLPNRYGNSHSKRQNDQDKVLHVTILKSPQIYKYCQIIYSQPYLLITFS